MSFKYYPYTITYEYFEGPEIRYLDYSNIGNCSGQILFAGIINPIEIQHEL